MRFMALNHGGFIEVGKKTENLVPAIFDLFFSTGCIVQYYRCY